MLLRRLVVGNAARARHDGHTDDVKPHRHRVDPAYRVTSEAKRLAATPQLGSKKSTMYTHDILLATS